MERIMSERYNGHANRATWAVSLHINNDEGWQTQIHDSVRETLADYPDTAYPDLDADDRDDIVNDVASNLEQNVTGLVDPHEYVANINPDITLEDWLNGPGLVAQDIGYLSEVNWVELAEGFISDVQE